MDSLMFAGLLPFAFFFAIFFGILLTNAMRGQTCPNCGQWLPGVVSPFRKTKRQWIEGGYVCTNCGCEMDVAGRRYATVSTAPRTSRAMISVLAISALAILMLVGVALVSTILYSGR